MVMLLAQGRERADGSPQMGAQTPMNNHPQQADELPTQPPHSASSQPAAAQARLIGERVRAARVATNLTQQELAGTTYTKSYISAVEHGKMTPSLPALHVLAERLDRPLSYLLGEDVREPASEAHEAPAEDEEHAAQLHEAERLVQEGRYEEAIARFEQIGQRDRTIWAYEQYAQFLAAEGRYQDAYEQMQCAIQRSR
jgi:HTH-type transcriptional regulator, quorum sensing regulator NprR